MSDAVYDIMVSLNGKTGPEIIEIAGELIAVAASYTVDTDGLKKAETSLKSASEGIARVRKHIRNRYGKRTDQ